jgi:hypothetical protein
MEINFDKEMDALLRQTVRRDINAPAAESHLDTDELAAFSANALPVKARTRAMEHLVDCGNCRTILSNLVFFEHQEEEKTSAALAATSAVSVAKEASLLERIVGFFKFPALAYGMACLVLVFGAAMALVVFQNNSGVEMAQLSKQDTTAPAKAVPAQDVGTLSEAVTQANSNAANAPGVVSAVNSASAGGVFTVPAASTSSGFSANTSANVASSTLKTESDDERREDSETKVNKTSVVVDGIVTSNDPEPKPAPPPPASGVRQETPQTAKPQNTEQTRSQDNFRSNNNIMTPDGSDKDRKRAVPAEAGANLSREGLRDEKEKQAATDAAASTPAKNESKKAAAKKTKKKTAAAEASAPPPNATPTPTPEKKKPEDERPPCR